MRVRLRAEDLPGLSDEALTIRLAGVTDAGDLRAMRLIGHEQACRRYATQDVQHRETEAIDDHEEEQP